MYFLLTHFYLGKSFILGFSLLPYVSVLQELIAVGLCNICSSFFKSFAISCAISGTVIQEKTGGRTQVSWAGFVKLPHSHLKSLYIDYRLTFHPDNL